jgi:hypothetical protein
VDPVVKTRRTKRCITAFFARCPFYCFAKEAAFLAFTPSVCRVSTTGWTCLLLFKCIRCLRAVHGKPQKPVTQKPPKAGYPSRRFGANFFSPKPGDPPTNAPSHCNPPRRGVKENQPGVVGNSALIPQRKPRGREPGNPRHPAASHSCSRARSRAESEKIQRASAAVKSRSFSSVPCRTSINSASLMKCTAFIEQACPIKGGSTYYIVPLYLFYP